MESTITYLKFGTADSTNSELLAAEQIAADQYRLIESPIRPRGLGYGTKVTAVINDAGELEFTGISEPSDYKTRMFIRAASLSGSELDQKIRKAIMNAGGYWENCCAGIAFVHLPKSSTFDLDGLFASNNYQPLEISL